MAKNKTYWLLFFVIALAFFLRVYKIDTIPPGVYPDEAVNGLDALEANDTGNYRWFYETNQGREGLFMNLVAVSIKLFGISTLALKLPAIIFGTFTVLGVYLLAKELFDSRRVGLLSSFLAAVSFWTIDFSRISFRANMVPAILAFSCYFLFKGLRTKKWQDFAIGGLIFGLGLHTYIAFRVAPLILVIMLAVLMLTREKFLKHYWKSILVFVLFAFITAGPMLYTFFVSHPEYWVSRTSSISIFNPEVNKGHFAQVLLKTLGLSLAKYNFWGDQNWRHNYPPYAILDPLTGIMFLFGFIYSIIKTFHFLYLRFSKKIRDTKLETYVFLLTAFFTMLIPEVLGYEGNPHALRAIGTIPAVFIFAGLGFSYFLGQADRYSLTHKKITVGLAVIMLVSIGLFNPIKYFVFWANNPKTAQSFEKTTADIEKYIETVSSGKEIFLVVGNMQRVPPRYFNWGNPNFHDLHPVEIAGIQPKNIQNFIVLFTDYQKDQIIENIKIRFPNMQMEEKKDNLGMSFYVFK
jgi:hypothetical protein